MFVIRQDAAKAATFQWEIAAFAALGMRCFYLYVIHLANSLNDGFLPYMRMPTR